MMKAEKILSDAYAVIGELWCSPQDVNMDEARRKAEEITARLTMVHPEVAQSLSAFLRAERILEEDYVALFELAPACPLYLGDHSFEEPKSCAGAGVSDRNKYMIDIRGIYGHFKLAMNGNELPDFLPVMMDFLSRTAEQRSDEVRKKFLTEYVLPFLPPLRKRLEELKTPYLHLLDAWEKILILDAAKSSVTKKEKAHVE